MRRFDELPSGRAGRPCPKAGREGDCGQLHYHCSAHNRAGGPCGAQPMLGTDPPRCRSHLGRPPEVVRAEYLAQRQARILFDDARRTARRYGAEGIDVLGELLALAEEALVWKRACQQLLGQLEEIRYRADGGEQLRAEVSLYTGAIERAAKILTDLARLNVAERALEQRRRLSDAQGEAVVAVVSGALHALGHDPQELAVRAAVARELRRLADADDAQAAAQAAAGVQV